MGKTDAQPHFQSQPTTAQTMRASAQSRNSSRAAYPNRILDALPDLIAYGHRKRVLFSLEAV